MPSKEASGSQPTVVAGTAPPSAAKSASRLDFVDSLRGLAVVFMIEWHTLDAWLLPSLRQGPLFDFLRLAGGMAAPLFLLLAGVSLGIKRSSDDRKGTPRWKAVRESVARGLEVVVFGYMLRFQMWLIDASAIKRLPMYRAIIPFVAAYALLLIGLRRLGGEPRRALVLLLPAIVLFALGIQQVSVLQPVKLEGLLRVDVLQAIGGSLVLVAVVDGLVRAVPNRLGLAVTLGLLVAAVTPLLVPLVPGPIPAPIAGYIARWDRTVAPGAPLFPLFPWAAYVFIGAAIGAAWTRASRDGTVIASVLTLAVVGAFIAIPTSEAVPLNHPLLASHESLVQPYRVIHRIGIALVLAAISLAVTRPIRFGLAPIRTFGRTSLLVYMVHLEFAFGAGGQPFKRKLGLGSWALGFAILATAMYVLARIRLGPWKRFWARVTTRRRNTT